MLTLQDLYICDVPLRLCLATPQVQFCGPGDRAAFLAEIAVTISAEDTEDAWEISAVTIGDQRLTHGKTSLWIVSWLMENRADELREHLLTQFPEAEAEAERERKYG